MGITYADTNDPSVSPWILLTVQARLCLVTICSHAAPKELVAIPADHVPASTILLDEPMLILLDSKNCLHAARRSEAKAREALHKANAVRTGEAAGSGNSRQLEQI